MVRKSLSCGSGRSLDSGNADPARFLDACYLRPHRVHYCSWWMVGGSWAARTGTEADVIDTKIISAISGCKCREAKDCHQLLAPHFLLAIWLSFPSMSPLCSRFDSKSEGEGREPPPKSEWWIFSAVNLQAWQEFNCLGKCSRGHCGTLATQLLRSVKNNDFQRNGQRPKCRSAKEKWRPAVKRIPCGAIKNQKEQRLVFDCLHVRSLVWTGCLFTLDT